MKPPDTPSDSKLASSGQTAPSGHGTEGIAPVSFEEGLRKFWETNRNAVYTLCGLVLAAIVAKGGWEYFSAQRQAEIAQEYDAAATPEMLKAFAATQGDKPLGGAANLRVADAAYAAGRASDAAAAYGKAIAALPPGPFAARARLGLAMAEIQDGRVADGETALRQLSGDATQLKSVRTEAGYHLASLAAAAGRYADVKSLAEQLVQIDSASPWTQRAFALQVLHPAPASGPAVQFGNINIK